MNDSPSDPPATPTRGAGTPDDSQAPQPFDDLTHKHHTIQDVAIIHAQAQMILRRVRLNGSITGDDLQARVHAILVSARRISESHR